MEGRGGHKRYFGGGLRSIQRCSAAAKGRVASINRTTLFGNCESATDHSPDHGPRYADRRPFRQSGPVQNRSGPAGPRLLDRTAATLVTRHNTNDEQTKTL